MVMREAKGRQRGTGCRDVLRGDVVLDDLDLGGEAAEGSRCGWGEGRGGSSAAARRRWWRCRLDGDLGWTKMETGWGRREKGLYFGQRWSCSADRINSVVE